MGDYAAALSQAAESDYSAPSGPPPPPPFAVRTTGSANGNSGTAAIVLSGAIQAGDIILVNIKTIAASPPTPTTPAGYTLIGNTTTGLAIRSATYGKIATAGDAGATVQATFAAGSWMVDYVALSGSTQNSILNAIRVAHGTTGSSTTVSGSLGVAATVGDIAVGFLAMSGTETLSAFTSSTNGPTRTVQANNSTANGTSAVQTETVTAAAVYTQTCTANVASIFTVDLFTVKP